MKNLLTIFIALIFFYNLSAQNTVTDIDGNVYNIVKYGSQEWMQENLKVTRYRNGDTIGTTYPATFVIDSIQYPKFQWAYDGNESNVETYGRLYTWDAAVDERGIAPEGWHIPSDNEWQILQDYLIQNGFNYDGTLTGNKIAKSMATSGWNYSPYVGAVGNPSHPEKVNSSGFTAVASGYRSPYNTFSFKGEMGIWWTSNEINYEEARTRSIYTQYDYFRTSDILKKSGRSLRCIKDTMATNININENNLKIKIYPNPTIDLINIDCGDFENANICIYDTYGKCLISLKAKKGINIIELNENYKGIYILKIFNKETYFVNKILKK